MKLTDEQLASLENCVGGMVSKVGLALLALVCTALAAFLPQSGCMKVTLLCIVGLLAVLMWVVLRCLRLECSVREKEKLLGERSEKKEDSSIVANIVGSAEKRVRDLVGQMDKAKYKCPGTPAAATMESTQAALEGISADLKRLLGR